MSEPGHRVVAGIAPGMVDPVLSILAASPSPVRRRKLLEELDRSGHRISLAGLNRILQYLAEAGRTVETPNGVRLHPRDAGDPPASID